MRKFLVSFCFISCFLISFAFADVTIDLSEYDLPDLTVSDSIASHSQRLLTSGSSYNYVFSDYPLEISGSTVYSVDNNNFVSVWNLSGNTWNNAGLDYETEEDEDIYNFASSVLYSNYIVYEYGDNSNVIYNPSQEGGESMSTVLTDLSTVMSAVLTNATSLVTWITNNPLVYLWVIMAIIIAIIAFVRGFIRGV